MRHCDQDIRTRQEVGEIEELRKIMRQPTYAWHSKEDTLKDLRSTFRRQVFLLGNIPSISLLIVERANKSWMVNEWTFGDLHDMTN